MNETRLRLFLNTMWCRKLIDAGNNSHYIKVLDEILMGEKPQIDYILLLDNGEYSRGPLIDYYISRFPFPLEEDRKDYILNELYRNLDFWDCTIKDFQKGPRTFKFSQGIITIFIRE